MWAQFVTSGAKKKGGGEWKLEDFMPKKKVLARSTKDLVAMAKHLNAMMGGKDLTKERN